jgi:hypothetical protein
MVSKQKKAKRSSARLMLVLSGVIFCLGIFIFVGSGLKFKKTLLGKLKSQEVERSAADAPKKDLGPVPPNSDVEARVSVTSMKLLEKSEEELSLGHFPLAPPSLAQVREEIQENPHVTPRSILAFASTLAPKIELALRSEEKATQVLEELEDCVLRMRGDSPVAIRAICLSNARFLGKRFPGLQPKIEALLEKSDSDSLRLLRAIGRF